MEILRDINGKEIKIGDYVLRHNGVDGITDEIAKAVELRRAIFRVAEHYEEGCKRLEYLRGYISTIGNLFEVVDTEKVEEINSNATEALVRLVFLRSTEGMWCRIIRTFPELPEEMEDEIEPDDYYEEEKHLMDNVDMVDEIRKNTKSFCTIDLNKIMIGFTKYEFIPFANKK